MIGIPGPLLDDGTKRLLETIDPLSIILFGRNIESPEQLSRLIAEISSFMGRKPVFAIDQEGGVVTRLTHGFTIVPGPMALAQAGGEEAAYEGARILGLEMKAVGIDWDLAPLADINWNRENRGIGIRSFSEEREQVTGCAAAFVRGLEEAGILSCLKHFPGLGGATADPHLSMPVVDCTKEELLQRDIRPFLEIDSPCWMPTHIHIPSLQSRRESVTVSSEVLTSFIRGELGFGGVLLGDDFNMKGASENLSLPELTVASFKAGMDILSICEGSENQLSAFRYLSRAIEEDEFVHGRYTESMERINRVLAPSMGGLKQDLSKLRSEESLSMVRELSQRSFTCIKKQRPLPGLSQLDNIFSMERQRLVMVEEEGGRNFYVAEKASRMARCPLHTIHLLDGRIEREEELVEAAAGKVNLAFTENAHLDRSVSSLITRLAEVSKSFHLIALRNPWDSDIEGVDNAYCTYGYTPEQQKNAMNILADKTGEECYERMPDKN